jgi:ABC-type transport system substrate-binding protein
LNNATWRRPGALLILLALLAGILAACGDDDDGGAAPDEEAEIDPNGVLRYGLDFQPGTATQVSLDPAVIGFNGQEILVAIYDTLLHRQPDGSYEPGLAESAEIVDSSTIRLELRDGVTFTDGTPFDAQAVKIGLERNAARTVAGFRPEMSQVAKVDVVDDLTAVIRLKVPSAGLFFPLLGDAESSIPSPAAIAAGKDLKTQPVGAGPFQVKSYIQGSKLELEPNPDWYDADEIELGGLEFIHVAVGPAVANSLRGGIVDYSESLTIDEATALPAPLVADIQPATSFMWLRMCTDARGGPLANKQVREALNYAVNREAMNDAVNQGEGEPAAGSWWPEDHPWYSESQAGRFEEDLDKAKSMLAQAGYANGFEFTTYIQPGASQRYGEILQQQLARVGVKLNLLVNPNVNTDFFRDARQPGYIYTQARPGLDKVTSGLSPGAFGNVCAYTNPAAFKVVDEIKVLPPESDEIPELWDELQDLLNDDPAGIHLAFGTNIVTYDEDRVGGVEYVIDQVATPRLMFDRVFIKA